jgi:hypothetical protein
MTKLKPEGWDQLSRSSKLAAVMWPQEGSGGLFFYFSG